MKVVIKKWKKWKRLLAMAVCIIFIVVLTGSPGVKTARAKGQPYSDQDKPEGSQTGNSSPNQEGPSDNGQSVQNPIEFSTQGKPSEAESTSQNPPGQDGQSGQTPTDQGQSGQISADQDKPSGQGQSGQTPADQDKPSGQGQSGQTPADQDKPSGQGENGQTPTDQNMPPGNGQPVQIPLNTDKQDENGKFPLRQDKTQSGSQEEKPDSHEQTGTDGEKIKAGELGAHKMENGALKAQDADNPAIHAKDNEIQAYGNIALDIANGTIGISDGAPGKLKITQTKGDQTSTSYNIASNDMITITGTYHAARIEKNVCYTINVNAPSVVDGVNITLQNLDLFAYTDWKLADPVQKSAFDIQGKTKVNLFLSGNNTLLTESAKQACINVPGDATLIVNGGASDSLHAEVALAWHNGQAMSVGAAIGSKWGNIQAVGKVDSGTIIIKGGNIEAIGGGGPGIGAGNHGIARNITIEGGRLKVRSQDSSSSAALGNGGADNDSLDRSKDQHITITGGFVSLDGRSQNAAAIGGGWHSGSGYVSITGGIVSVTGRAQNAIGPGYSKNPDSFTNVFTTGSVDPANKGSANPIIILGKTGSEKGGFIYDKSHKAAWQGVIFEDKTGHVYGTPNIDTSFTIESGYTLYIDEGQGVINDNKGVTLALNGTLVNNGTIDGGLTLIVGSTGVAQNNGRALNGGTIQIDKGGRLENGSAAVPGTALLENELGSKLIVNGEIYNYANITGPGTDAFLSGTGAVWCLPNVKVKVIKDGTEVTPGVSVVPLEYMNHLQIKASVTGPLYQTVGNFTPGAAGEVSFSLINDTTEASLGSRPFDGQSQTFSVTSTTAEVGGRVQGVQGLLPWEGDKPLTLKISVPKFGGGTAVSNKPSMGYIARDSSVSAQYPKVDPGVTSWPTADNALIDTDLLFGARLKGGASAQPGVFSWVNPGDGVKWGTENYPAQFVPTDSANYKTVTKDIHVTVKPLPRIVTYSPQSGSFPGMAAGQTVTKPNAQNRLPLRPEMMPDKDPVKDRSIFTGWYKDQDCKEPWGMADLVMSDMTLYAGYATTEPDVGFIIPTNVSMINDPGTGEAKGKGTIQVRAVEAGSGDRTYPARVTVSAAPDVVLTGKKGLTRTAKVFKADGSPYDGSTALMTFDFKNTPAESEKYDFWLGMPIDDSQRQAAIYMGGMTITFDTTAATAAK